jgi:hypothetical protein
MIFSPICDNGKTVYQVDFLRTREVGSPKIEICQFNKENYNLYETNVWC